jgi:hypothetical protein
MLADLAGMDATACCNPPDEVGERPAMRLAISQLASSFFFLYYLVACGGQIVEAGPASYTTQPTHLGVPSHQEDVRVWQYGHPGFALSRECILYWTRYDMRGAFVPVQRTRTTVGVEASAHPRSRNNNI